MVRTVLPVLGADDFVAQVMDTERLKLEPLRAGHADEMAPVLDDPALHVFTGGEPASGEELRSRYERQIAGLSPDGSERWLNWVVRRRDDARAVGTVQATVKDLDGTLTAHVAWVIGSPHQGRGFATEAARAMVTWLRRQGVEVVVARVHPRHEASKAIARAVGLAPTGNVFDGEVRWEG